MFYNHTHLSFLSCKFGLCDRDGSFYFVKWWQILANGFVILGVILGNFYPLDNLLLRCPCFMTLITDFPPRHQRKCTSFPIKYPSLDLERLGFKASFFYEVCKGGYNLVKNSGNHHLIFSCYLRGDSISTWKGSTTLSTVQEWILSERKNSCWLFVRSVFSFWLLRNVTLIMKNNP